LLDTVVRGGLVATADACFRADIGIRAGRIAAIGDGLEGRRVIDVDGCIVMPGAIDVHTHFDTSLGEATTADDYESGSRAAAFGGITTFVNYAFPDDGGSLRAAVEREAAKASAASHLDYSFHPVVTRVRDAVLAELRPLRDAGFTSVKVFTAVPGSSSQTTTCSPCCEPPPTTVWS
jgi:dihydropyrimidinase